MPFDHDYIEEFVVRTGVEEGILRFIITINEIQRVQCEHLLNNTHLLQELRNFDLIVYEGGALCAPLVADLLGLPRVVIIPISPNMAISSYFKIPFPVSYVPLDITTFTSEMLFTQRLANFGLYIFSQLASYVVFASYMSPLKDKYNITPEMSYHEAFGNVQLVIIEADFALEFPQPLLPGLPSITF